MSGFRSQQWVVQAIFGTLAALGLLRVAVALHALQMGEETALLTLPLGVIFPVVLVAALLRMPPTRTQEGLLMRLATAAHLTLIVAVPSLALPLALGLPVVFLLVELFETRIPPTWRDRVVRAVLA
jgi:hypothetical protein